MATTWTLPVQDILTDALQLIGALGAGETASAEDNDVAMRALQGILKELPLHGVSWPKVTVDPVSLAWDAASPAKVTLPADYFGVPHCYYLADDGGKAALRVVAKAEYEALPDPAATAERPELIYIGPNNTALLYPVPMSDPGLTLTYQAITSDATLAAAPDVAQTWIAGLGLWVANEIAPKFNVDMATRQDIAARFMPRRQLMLAYACETAPISFTVAD